MAATTTSPSTATRRRRRRPRRRRRRPATRRRARRLLDAARAAYIESALGEFAGRRRRACAGRLTDSLLSAASALIIVHGVYTPYTHAHTLIHPLYSAARRQAAYCGRRLRSVRAPHSDVQRATVLLVLLRQAASAAAASSSSSSSNHPRRSHHLRPEGVAITTSCPIDFRRSDFFFPAIVPRSRSPAPAPPLGCPSVPSWGRREAAGGAAASSRAPWTSRDPHASSRRPAAEECPWARSRLRVARTLHAFFGRRRIGLRRRRHRPAELGSHPHRPGTATASRAAYFSSASASAFVFSASPFSFAPSGDHGGDAGCPATRHGTGRSATSRRGGRPGRSARWRRGVPEKSSARAPGCADAARATPAMNSSSSRSIGVGGARSAAAAALADVRIALQLVPSPGRRRSAAPSRPPRVVHR